MSLTNLPAPGASGRGRTREPRARRHASDASPPPRVLIVGSPNSGKSTLFNALTGLFQHVGNYPGVTVERKSGRLCLAAELAAAHRAGTADSERMPTGVELVDLPGTYSLTPRSPDEALATRMILGLVPGELAPDGLVIVVDAANLRRQLYLVMQALELGVPTVVALNMVDVAKREGLEIDADALAERLGVEVVPTIATRRPGVRAIRAAIARLVAGAPAPPTRWRWPDDVADEVVHVLSHVQAPTPGARALAARALVDETEHARTMLTELAGVGGVDGGRRDGDAVFAPSLEALEAARARLRASGTAPPALETRWRYAVIDGLLAETVRDPGRVAGLADRADAVLTHRVFGPIIFALIMGAMFMSIFEWAAPVMDLVDGAFVALGSLVSGVLAGTSLHGGVLESLLVDGVITGVGSVLVFVPQIAFLFLFLAVLEGCGYLARTALMMDRLLRWCGLSGHSFIPMLSSFACAIPGVMSARTIADGRERLITILVAPLMSCSARIPVYTILIAAFVPQRMVLGFLPLQGLVFFGMYLVGIGVAIPVAFVLKRLLRSTAPSSFVMELPPYRKPSLRTVAMRVALPVRAFIQQAGTIILAMAILVWALGTFPHSADVAAEREAAIAQAERTLEGEALAQRIGQIDRHAASAQLETSALGRMGRAVEPVVAPLGWDWRLGTAAIASFPAREVVVSTLGIIYGLGAEGEDAALVAKLRSAERPDGRPLFTLAVALSVMVFFALCCQCGATIATIRRETASVRWPIFVFTYMTVLAYIGSLLVYQIGSRIG